MNHLHPQQENDRMNSVLEERGTLALLAVFVEDLFRKCRKAQ